MVPTVLLENLTATANFVLAAASLFWTESLSLNSLSISHPETYNTG